MHFSLTKNRVIIWISIVLIITIGSFLATTASISLYPKTSKPIIRFGISHVGMSSNQFEEDYGENIESILSQNINIEKFESFYSKSEVEFIAEFGWNIDSDKAKSEINQIQSSVVGQFPRHWGSFWTKEKFANTRRTAFMLSSTKFPESIWGQHFRKVYLPKFQNIKGVDYAFLSRYDKKKLVVSLDSDKLAFYGITPNKVRLSLKENEFDYSLGEWEKQDNLVYVTLLGSSKSLENIKNIYIESISGAEVPLHKIADVYFEKIFSSQTLRRNGENISFFGVVIKEGADLVRVSNEVDRLISSIKNSMPHLVFDNFLNPKEVIYDAIFDIVYAILIGIFSAMLMLYIFLKRISVTFIIAICIPLSILSGVIILNFLGIGINLISVGAIAIVSGMVIDGAVVVLENIFRNFNEQKIFSSQDLILHSTKEMRTSLISSVMTSVIVFLPLPFTSSISSALLGDLAVVIVCVLLSSLLVTIYFIPTIVYSFHQKGWLKIDHRSNNRKTNITYSIQNIYRSFLAYVLSSQKVMVLSCLTMLTLMVLCVFFVSKLEKEIISTPESKVITVDLFFDKPSKNHSELIKLLDQIEDQLHPLIKNKVKSWVQISLSGKFNKGKFYVILKDRKHSVSIKNLIREHLPSTEDYQVKITSWNPTSLKIEDTPDLTIGISGENHTANLSIMKQIKGSLKKSKAISRLELKPSVSQSENIYLTIDSKYLNHLQLNTSINSSKILDHLSFLFEERYIRDFPIDDELMSMYLKIDNKRLKDISDLNNLQISLTPDRRIPLKSFVAINSKLEHDEKYKKNGVSAYEIDLWNKSSIYGFKKDRVYSYIQNYLDSQNIDKNKWSFVESESNIKKSIISLIKALFFSLILMFFLLYIQFQKINQVIIILSAVPFGIVGSILSLYLFNSVLSVNSLLGMILLSGVAVNNSILMVDLFNRTKEEYPELGINELIVFVSSIRLRPILITSLTTMLGMIPIALAIGSSGRVLQPLGLAISGGLLISTLCVLLFVPILLKFDNSCQSVNV